MPARTTNARTHDLEVLLPGGNTSAVVRTGTTIRRRTGPWTPAVHALLHYLEGVGFEGAPLVRGVDQHGREILSFVPGTAPHPPLPHWATSDDALAGVGQLLGAFHRAVSGFVPPADAYWRFWVNAPMTADLVCHNDVLPGNVVFQGGKPVALIDWDFAAPGPRLLDFASAAKSWVPLLHPEHSADHGWPPRPPAPRLRLLADAYELTRVERAQVVGLVEHRHRMSYASHRAWASARDPAFQRMWRCGSGDRILRDLDWVRSMRAELAAALA